MALLSLPMLKPVSLEWVAISRNIVDQKNQYTSDELCDCTEVFQYPQHLLQNRVIAFSGDFEICHFQSSINVRRSDNRLSTLF